MNAPLVTWTAPIVTLLILLPVPGWAVEMQWVPTSISILPGEDATIPCNFNGNDAQNVNISWFLFQRQVNKTDGKSFVRMVQKILPNGMQNLTIRSASKTDSGIYVCKVTTESDIKESCGTYLRVRELPGFIFFNIAEATKNRLITAEGIILLLCAIIPGTFLLYKKRMENLSSFSLKEIEGENLYEGLNLEDCSMYEDISRGLQATYEDVGTLRAGDIHLEKP